jgi:hypothetical protein
MKKFGRMLFRIGKGFYDILASYLLAVVLYVAFVSLGLHAAFSLLAGALGMDDVAMMWSELARRMDVSGIWVRLIVYGGIQLGLFWLLKGPLKVVGAGAEKVVDKVQAGYLWCAERLPRASVFTGGVFTVGVTLLLIPFLVQPTLVPLRADSYTMTERVANLVDGTATLALHDSVVGFYRRLYEEPKVQGGRGVDPLAFDDAIARQEQEDEAIERDPTGTVIAPDASRPQPMMDRWDPIIWAVAENDPHRFAQIKAFMYTESAGRQFAVSHTGCMGLMQFCSGTAKRSPFKEVFGTGQVYTCGCRRTSCAVSKQVQRDMERGSQELVNKHKDAFPCELTDARFDAEKAIRAGGLYVANLDKAVGGNIYLMYVGYNSGPAVARKVYNALGKNPDATLAQIEAELPGAMERWYHEKSARRARSLVKRHLPKIKRMYDRYYAAATAEKGQPVATYELTPASFELAMAPQTGGPFAEFDLVYGREDEVE